MGGMVGDFLDWALGAHDVTITNIQFSKLLTPGAAVDRARKNARHLSGGSASTYNTGYQQFKKQYKKKYSKQFLQSLGYAPSSTATTYAIQNNLVQSWLANNYGYSNTTINEAQDKYLTVVDIINYGKQNTTGFDPDTGWLTSSGNKYKFVSGNIVNPTTVGLLWRRYYEDTIVGYLTANYSYNSTNHTVVISGLVYGIGTISDEVVSGNYHVVAVRSGNPDVTISIPVEDLNTSYYNDSFDNEVTWISYNVLGGTGIGTGTRYVMTTPRSLPIYSNTTIDITAVIPMKEDNNMVDMGNHSLKRLLKKLHISPSNLISSLDNTDIYSAYLMTVLDPNINDNVHNKVMFEMFDLMGSGGSVSVAISHLDMSYTFGLTKAEITGVVAPVGGCVRSYQPSIAGTSDSDEGTSSPGQSSVMTLRYQGSATTYREIQIIDFSQTYTISGHKITTTFDNTSGQTQLLIPLQVFNALDFKEWCAIYETGLSFLVFSAKTVHVSWYETGLFRFIMMVIAVILMFIPGTQGAGVTLMQIATRVVIMMAVLYVANWIAVQIGGTTGAIIGAIVAVVAAAYFGYVDMSDGQGWLQLANTGLNTINQNAQHEMDKLVADYDGYMAAMKEKIDDLEKKIEEYKDNDIMVNNMLIDSIGRRNPLFNTIENYVNSIVNTEYLVEGSWMYDVTGEVERRNKVYVGV
jgi:hypothetical protein